MPIFSILNAMNNSNVQIKANQQWFGGLSFGPMYCTVYHYGPRKDTVFFDNTFTLNIVAAAPLVCGAAHKNVKMLNKSFKLNNTFTWSTCVPVTLLFCLSKLSFNNSFTWSTFVPVSLLLCLSKLFFRGYSVLISLSDGKMCFYICSDAKS